MHRICGRSSSGRAPPCQGGGSEFEPRRPLHRERNIPPVLVAWPCGKAKVCKTFIHQFKSGRHLQNSPGLRSGAFCFYLCKHKTRPGMLSTSPVLFIPRYNSSCPFPSSDPMPCPPVSGHRPGSPLLLPGQLHRNTGQQPVLLCTGCHIYHSQFITGMVIIPLML